MTNTYKTQEEIYLAWYADAAKNKKLLDVKFYAGEILETDAEDFYREANHFNIQLDREDITPRIQVAF